MSSGKSEIDKLKKDLERETEARRLAEEKLEACESDLQSVIDNIQDVFYRSDVNGRLTMISRSWLTLTGYDAPDECLGRDVAEFYYAPEERGKLLELLRKNGSVTDYEVVLKDGG